MHSLRSTSDCMAARTSPMYGMTTAIRCILPPGHLLANLSKGCWTTGSTSTFFRVEAEEGREYQIDVEHNALRATSVWVYNHYGFGPGRLDPQPGTWEAELGPSGPRVSWVAPQSGTFYAAVENFRGQSGPYAFTITPIG